MTKDTGGLLRLKLQQRTPAVEYTNRSSNAPKERRYDSAKASAAVVADWLGFMLAVRDHGVHPIG